MVLSLDVDSRRASISTPCISDVLHSLPFSSPAVHHASAHLRISVNGDDQFPNGVETDVNASKPGYYSGSKPQNSRHPRSKSQFYLTGSRVNSAEVSRRRFPPHSSGSCL